MFKLLQLNFYIDKQNIGIMKFVGVFSLLILLFSFNPHPLHLTVAEAHWKKESKSIEVAVKLFYDDFENALKQTQQQVFYLCPDSANEHIDFIDIYFRKEFQLTINEKIADFELIGYECEDELVFVYLEYTNISKIKSVKIRNTLLFESFLDQTNLVHFHMNDLSKTLLTQPKSLSTSIEYP